MSFQKKIEQYLEQIYILEETFRKVQNSDPLPLSFFSTSIDILNKLKLGIHELESIQLQIMTKNLEDNKKKLGIEKGFDLELAADPINQPEEKSVDLPTVNQPAVNQPNKKTFDLPITNQPGEEKLFIVNRPTIVNQTDEQSIDLDVTLNPENQPEEKTATPIRHSGFLGDTIIRKIYPDFRKSLTLNHRFMFQRDIFRGNVEKMERTLSRINTFQNLNEAVSYLDENYLVQWESDAGIALRDLLEKRFS